MKLNKNVLCFVSVSHELQSFPRQLEHSDSSLAQKVHFYFVFIVFLMCLICRVATQYKETSSFNFWAV